MPRSRQRSLPSRVEHLVRNNTLEEKIQIVRDCAFEGVHIDLPTMFCLVFPVWFFHRLEEGDELRQSVQLHELAQDVLTAAFDGANNLLPEPYVFGVEDGRRLIGALIDSRNPPDHMVIASVIGSKCLLVQAFTHIVHDPDDHHNLPCWMLAMEYLRNHD
jgi:hypothetical protein